MFTLGVRRARWFTKSNFQLTSWWYLLGNPKPIGWSVIWPFALAAMWVTVVFDMPIANGSGLERQHWMLAGLVSTFAAVAWLLALQKLVSITPGKSRPWIVLAGFGFTGLIRNLSLTVLCQQYGLVAPSSRLVSSILASLALLTILSLTSTRLSENKETLASLRAERSKLLWLSASFDEKVAQAHRELHKQIDEELLPAVTRVLRQLETSESSVAAAVSESIIQTVTGVVRPLTDRLSQRSGDLLEQLDFVSATVDQPTDIDRKHDIRRILRPSWPTLMLILVAACTSPMLNQANNFLLFSSGCLLAWSLAFALRRFWPVRFAMQSEAVATLIWVTVPSLVFGVTGFLLAQAGLDEAVVVAQVTFAIGGSLILGRILIADQSAKLMQQQLALEIETLEQLISQLRKQIWITRRKATWVLHGPIQSALVSSALSLAQASSFPVQKSEIRKRIEAALAALASDSLQAQDLGTTLNEIATVWQRTAATAWRMSSAAAAALATDPDSVSCLAEIAREGVSNAVRHGHATQIEVEISIDDSGHFEIRVIDNGVGLYAAGSDAKEVGFGSAMLDEISLRWARYERHGRTVLEAVVLPAMPNHRA